MEKIKGHDSINVTIARQWVYKVVKSSIDQAFMQLERDWFTELAFLECCDTVEKQMDIIKDILT